MGLGKNPNFLYETLKKFLVKPKTHTQKPNINGFIPKTNTQKPNFYGFIPKNPFLKTQKSLGLGKNPNFLYETLKKMVWV